MGSPRWLIWLTSPRYALIRLIILVLIGALCLGGAAWGALSARSWSERALPLDDPLANLNELGVNVELTLYTAQEREQVLSEIKRSGLRWVRQRFPWDEIEPERGQYAWAAWDTLLADCAEHDLRVLAVLDGAPFWASGQSAELLAPPHEVSDWGSFVAAFSSRYQGQIAAYQLWDEPNLSAHWGGRYVDPVVYTALLREGAIRVRDADPGVPVLMGALAPTVENGPLNLNEVAFLKQVLDAGGRPFFDVVTVQPYGFGLPPEASGQLDVLSWGRAAAVRTEMVRMGLADCPVWATAWGWRVADSGEATASPWPFVSQEQQTTFTLDALSQVRRSWPWMGPLILASYQPDVPGADPRWGLALLDSDGTETELYGVLREHMAQTQPLGVGCYRPAAETVQDEGSWRFSDDGADPPHGAEEMARNAVLSFDFYGTMLDLEVRRGDFWGYWTLLVDGRPAPELPKDERGRAYLILHDPLGGTETVTVARDLSPDTVHHLELVAHGGWGQWPLVGWVVREQQARPPGRGAPGLVMWGVLFLLAGVIQFVSAPSAAQPVYAAVGTVFNRYRALPEWLQVSATWGTALALYLVPWTPLSLILLVVLGVLVFLRLDLGLAVVALALPFYARPKMLLGRPFSPVELSLGLCVLAWLLARLLDWGRKIAREGAMAVWTRLLQGFSEWPVRLTKALKSGLWRKLLWGKHTLDAGVILFVLVAWWAVGLAEQQAVATRELRVVFVESALFYALIRLALRSDRAHQRLLQGWLLGAVVVSVLALIQWGAGENLITTIGGARVRGPYGSPNNLALYLERAWPVLLAFVMFGGRRRWWQIAAGVSLVLVSAALLLTFSKGALLLGLPAALLVVGLIPRRRWSTWTTVVLSALGLIVILVLVFAPLSLAARFRGWFDPQTGTGFFRLKLWRSTLSMIADHPLGVGLDNFLYLYRTRYVLPSAWGELDLSHPHNVLLDAWTRLGPLGLIVILWLLASFIHTTWGKVSVFGENRTHVLGVLGAVTALLAHGMVDHSLFLVDLAFVFMLLLAVGQRE